MTSRPTGRTHVASGLLAALLVVASTVAPAVHALLERLSAAPAVEANHTAQCPTIHIDALCSTCQAADIAGGATAAHVSFDDAGERLRCPTAGRLRLAVRNRRGDTVRAPPIA